MINTLPLNEFEKYASSIYEAIIVLAKRARQINDQQKRVFFREGEDEYEEFDEDSEEISAPATDYVELPKPTTLALEEFLSGKLQYEYSKTEETEAEPPQEK
jgi:DNA-directed RNA polymerase subunit K/omega